MLAFARYLDDSEAGEFMQSTVLLQRAKLAAEAAAKDKGPKKDKEKEIKKNNEPVPMKLKIVRYSRPEVQNETGVALK